MVKSLYSGVSGLKTHQQRMDVIGNNIANVNTVGNKADVVTFKDVYYQTKRSPSAATATLGGVNPRQVGYGVQMNTTTANMTQSGYTQSDNTFDMAINGQGFFQVMDGAGNIFYTRAGVFNVDEEGYVVNADGYHVLGVTGNSDGQAAGSEILRLVIPDTDAHASSATKKIAGTNVTLSVTAPSDYTNMSVTFVESQYPYATYANNILSIYFNSDEQYESEQDFENAINQALQAGGVSLPDDVELSFDFESIPDEPQSVAGKNSVSGLKFTTTNATCQIDHKFDNGEWGYMAFSVDDNTNRDSVNVKLVDGEAPPKVEYADGKWTVSICTNTTAGDIQDAIKEFLEDNPNVPRLSLDSFVVPTTAGGREAALKEWFGEPADDAAGVTEQLFGVKDASIASGLLDLDVQEKGAFSNDYKVVFSYVSGYDKTKAVWDENTLTVSVCANSTIADVNEAIRRAANGDDKKIIIFNDISGLDYGVGYTGNVFKRETTPAADGTGGYTVTITRPDGTVLTEKYDANGVRTAFAQGDITAANPAPDGYTAPTTEEDFYNYKTEVWNPGTRDAFFSGHPSITPAGGDDSFFTKVAKGLSTFALTDGRTGDPQSIKDVELKVQQDGTIIGTHPIFGTMVLGRIDLATFDNPNGLAKVGGTNFQETVASGPAKLGIPGSGNTGVVLSGTLEMSNVDLADEFTNMITTQRGYQANSRVITVSDTMLEELLSLKR